jgi:hypothetical protein
MQLSLPLHWSERERQREREGERKEEGERERKKEGEREREREREMLSSYLVVISKQIFLTSFLLKQRLHF